MGSWPFIIVQSILLTLWIGLNVSELVFRAWDPYPFILLNLMLSFQAAYAAPFIMMSQNRQSAKDRLAAELDLQTNLRAEALLEDLHGAMETLRRHQWKDLLDIQQSQIELMQTLLRRVPVRDTWPLSEVGQWGTVPVTANTLTDLATASAHHEAPMLGSRVH